MPKLFDIAAIFGLSNPSVVKRLISNVFENEKRYIQDFKDSIDMARVCLKTLFNKSRQVSEMVRGELVKDTNRDE